MQRILTDIGVLLLVVAAASSAGTVVAQGTLAPGKGTGATAAAPLRSAQDAAHAAVQGLKTSATALKANPDDATARRAFQTALTRALDARKHLEVVRNQADAQLEAKPETPPAPAAVPHEQRYLSVHNLTRKTVTISVQVYAKNDQGAWGWLPAPRTAGKTTVTAAAYRLEPGQSSHLGHEGRKLAGSKARFWVQWPGGEFSQYRTRDLWLVPELDAGGQHRYRAAAMQTYPLKLLP